ncbi:MAG TPA: hypothetical protein VFV87_14405 [Pirellulaceae bacterium]|nr:hypothetical protein [Pirellulaceae bacterium]
MSAQIKSILAGFVVVAAALGGFAWLGMPTSHVFAQAKAPALAAEAKAREANARIAEAEAAEAQARAIAAEAAAAKNPPAPAADAGDATPLDLSKHLRMKAENFQKITRFPWPAVPTGSQAFAGIPVDIQGALMTFGQRNADNGLKYPETITGIPCGQRFETLYIMHGTFYEGDPGESAFDVVLNYPGDEQQTITILCGEDTRDWYIKPGEKSRGPTGKRSTLAWTGTGKAGDRDQEIRFCPTAIDNKYPDRLVETIDLVSAKKQTAGCILAISVGKKGLLKPEPENPAENPASGKPALKSALKPNALKVPPPKVKLPASP